MRRPDVLGIVLTYLAGLGLTPFVMIAVGKLARRRNRIKARRLLVGTPRMLSDGREGTIMRLTGTVRALEPLLTSPLSRQPCVAYRARAVDLRQALGTPFPFGQPTSYQTVKIQSFAIVRPNEPEVVVEASYAEFDLPFVKLQLSARDEQAFFFAHKVIATGGAGHFDEVVVADGDPITIAGTLVRELDTEAHDERGFRDGPPRKLQLVGDGPHPIVIGREA